MKIKDLNFKNINSAFVTNLKEADNEDSIDEFNVMLNIDEKYFNDFNNRYINPINISMIIKICDYFLIENTKKFIFDNCDLTDVPYIVDNDLECQLPIFLTEKKIEIKLENLFEDCVKNDSVRWYRYFIEKYDFLPRDAEGMQYLYNLFFKFDSLEIFKYQYERYCNPNITPFGCPDFKYSKEPYIIINFNNLFVENSVKIFRYIMNFIEITEKIGYELNQLVIKKKGDYKNFYDFIRLAIAYDSLEILKEIIDYFDIEFYSQGYFKSNKLEKIANNDDPKEKELSESLKHVFLHKRRKDIPPYTKCPNLIRKSVVNCSNRVFDYLIENREKLFCDYDASNTNEYKLFDSLQELSMVHCNVYILNFLINKGVEIKEKCQYNNTLASIFLFEFCVKNKLPIDSNYLFEAIESLEKECVKRSLEAGLKCDTEIRCSNLISRYYELYDERWIEDKKELEENRRHFKEFLYYLYDSSQNKFKDSLKIKFHENDLEFFINKKI